MKLVIIGHRGTGKTSFLRRLKSYGLFSGPFFDLDQEIEKEMGLSVKDFFEKYGEAQFRLRELEIFQNIYKTSEAFVMAVGGGFPSEEIPKNVKVLWVRRPSDTDGRIFIDRPSLTDFAQRWKDREGSFFKRADEIYVVPEGMTFAGPVATEIEKKIVSGDIFSVGGMKTILPIENLPNAIPDFYELRSDLLTEGQIKEFSIQIPSEKILFSLRNDIEIPPEIRTSTCLIDVDTELMANADGIASERLILSSHHESIFDGIESLNKSAANFLKLSPLIRSWPELIEGHRWQQEDPECRSFLPRSTDGQWQWYRLYQMRRQKINFWRNSEGSAPDQPCLFQWMAASLKFSKFAAVLGSPVSHSYSPMFHLDFFRRREMPFFSIDIKVEDWTKATPFLFELGLVAAAVTSPLKFEVYSGSDEKTEIAKELATANTLFIHESQRLVHNTDFLGFKKVLKDLPMNVSAAMWGGGGTRSMVKKLLPQIADYSSRSGHIHDKEKSDKAPQAVVWAAPRRPETKMPPMEWSPQLILDLSYRQDSMGLEYAQKSGAKYVSGLAFFEAQALEQQHYWSAYL